MKNKKTVEKYISKNEQWQEVLLLLREILLSTKLEETIKWGIPVYSIEKKNVVGMGSFKAYVGLWFYQGVFLTDDKQKLINAQEGVTKAMRQWRFSSVEEILSEKETIKLYLKEAILNQEQGKGIKPERNKALLIPAELEVILTTNSALKQAFEAFSLSRKREFTEYISEAKRVETKQKRLDKIKPMILEGIGLNDKYRK